MPFKKKSAIPEYIWYISLIVIAIVLVTTIVSLTQKAKDKNVKLPDISDAQLYIYKDPLGNIKIGDIRVLGIKKQDLNNVYLYCDGTYYPLSAMFNVTIDFARTQDNYLSLNKQNYVINFTKFNYSDKCKEEGALWALFYGNPKESGMKIAETKLEFRSTWS